MITYILLSYLVMLIWCLKWLILDPCVSFKDALKDFLIAPLSMPLNIIRKFNEW